MLHLSFDIYYILLHEMEQYTLINHALHIELSLLAIHLVSAIVESASLLARVRLLPLDLPDPAKAEPTWELVIGSCICHCKKNQQHRSSKHFLKKASAKFFRPFSLSSEYNIA